MKKPNIGTLAIHRASSEDSDQTGRMLLMISVFAGCTDHFAGFVMLRLILLVLTVVLMYVGSFFPANKYVNVARETYTAFLLSFQ